MHVPGLSSELHIPTAHHVVAGSAAYCPTESKDQTQVVGSVCESRIRALPYPFGSITESKIRCEVEI